MHQRDKLIACLFRCARIEWRARVIFQPELHRLGVILTADRGHQREREVDSGLLVDLDLPQAALREFDRIFGSIGNPTVSQASVIYRTVDWDDRKRSTLEMARESPVPATAA